METDLISDPYQIRVLTDYCTQAPATKPAQFATKSNFKVEGNDSRLRHHRRELICIRFQTALGEGGGGQPPSATRKTGRPPSESEGNRLCPSMAKSAKTQRRRNYETQYGGRLSTRKYARREIDTR